MQFQFYLSPLGCNMQNITHNMDETKDDTEILSSSYKSFFFFLLIFNKFTTWGER